MKTNKIRWLFVTILSSCSLISFAQLPPTNTSPSGVPSGTNDKQFWSRAGNTSVQGINNLFGTNFNSPIFTITNGAGRSRLNGSVAYSINTFPTTAKDGYLMLGVDGVGGGGRTLYGTPNYGAFSLLHLNGTPNSGTVQEFGYRPWMQTGVTFTSNSDLAYVGHKSNGADVTDMVVAWSDNSTGLSGPDVMKFAFTTGQGASAAIGADLDGTHLNGREIMRLTGYGNIGVGPRFNNSFQPKSTYHQHQQNDSSSWMQITNQTMTVAGIQAGPTNISTGNGFRFGILGDPLQIRNGNAFIYNQEKRHLIFSTGNPTPTNPIGTNERMRITSIENPTNLYPTGYGINNPSGFLLPAELRKTRVSISEDPAAPLQRPMSLLHLGYDVGVFEATGATDGWRKWMDIGTFTGSFRNDAYLGLKQETSVAGDDVVLSWGGNQVPVGIDGATNFRFIFAANPLVAGSTAPATGANGLEGGRMTPTTATGVFTGFGGDPTAPNKYGPLGTSINPTNTLEVNSWGLTTTPGGSSGLRFTNLQSSSPTIANPGPGVLAVDKNGDVIYVPGGNGLGNYCTATPVLNPLVGFDYEIPLNNFNYRFAGQAVPFTPGPAPNNKDVVGIGYDCGMVMPAKLSVLENAGPSIIVSTTAGAFLNQDVSIANASLTYRGVLGISNGIQPMAGISNIGGEFRGANSAISIGVRGSALGTPTVPGVNYGGYFYANSAGPYTNVGVYGTSGGGSVVNYAGVFVGNVLVNGSGTYTGTWVPSDSTYKTNVDTITNALTTIGQLKPKSFYMDTLNTVGLNFTSEKQYGFIAQDVAHVLPELVRSTIKPADYDTSGVLIHPAITFKTLNYNALFGILTKGIQEQQREIDSLQNGGTINGANNGVSVTGTNVELGNIVGQTSAQLTSDREIPLNAQKLFFSGQTGSDQIYIGQNTNSGFNGKLNVLTQAGSNQAAIHAKCDNPSSPNTAVRAEAVGSSSSAENDGVFSTASNGHNVFGVKAEGGLVNGQGGTAYGLYGYAFTTQTSSSVQNIGVRGAGLNSNYLNAGGVFSGTSSNGSYGFGILADASGNGTNWAGYFNGDVNVNGNYYQNSVLFTSDQNLKTNIDTIADAMHIINQLKPKTFYFDTLNAHHMKLPTQKQYGLIAQQVATVLPELVTSNTTPATHDSLGNVVNPAYTYKVLNYNAFIAIMMKGMQSQQSKIDSLTQAMTTLTNNLNSCCNNHSMQQNPNANTNSIIGGIDVNLKDGQSVILNQNVPNPFAEQTTIGYVLPENFSKAQILFYNSDGRLIQSVELHDKGKGQLNVFADDLSNGIYSYTLVVDGKIIDTKKMVKQ